MPRANRYLLPGSTCHLTHRCHDRAFLLRFARDRDAYRRVLYETKPRHGLYVLAYCITHNHVHLLTRIQSEVSLCTWMQRAEGQWAQQYNRRKQRTGAFWEGRYHCTLIGDPLHTQRCMTYIELNMVRAGVVAHPVEWRWCSYQEWLGQRQRYRLLDLEPALEHLGSPDLAAFRQHYEQRVQERIGRDAMAREPWWTESVAVGDETFVRQVELAVRWRQGFDRYAVSSDTNCLREEPPEPARLGPWTSTPVVDVRGGSCRPLPSLRARRGDKTSP
ncbi:MAG: transposase [Verrucomicrobiales bacterium]|nr:transposase [Verrucomicrobiales bacterium]